MRNFCFKNGLNRQDVIISVRTMKVIISRKSYPITIFWTFNQHTQFISTVALTALVAVCSGQTTNYCTAGLCSAGKTHIACNGLTTLSSTCGAGASEATLDCTKKNLIVNVHNQLRNTVALGKQANGAGQYFNQAAKMATLVSISFGAIIRIDFKLIPLSFSNGTKSWPISLLPMQEVAFSGMTSAAIRLPWNTLARTLPCLRTPVWALPMRN